MRTQTIRDLAARDRLTDAFFELYALHRIEEISINDISRQAGFNRSAFHLYYKDINDMLRQAEKQLEEVAVSLLTGLLALAAPDPPLAPAHKRDYPPRSLSYIKTLLGKNGDPAFRALLHGRMREAALTLYPPPPAAEDAAATALRADYIAGGLIALVSAWLEQDCPLSFEQLGGLLRDNLLPRA